LIQIESIPTIDQKSPSLVVKSGQVSDFGLTFQWFFERQTCGKKG